MAFLPPVVQLSAEPPRIPGAVKEAEDADHLTSAVGRGLFHIGPTSGPTRRGGWLARECSPRPTRCCPTGLPAAGSSPGLSAERFRGYHSRASIMLLRNRRLMAAYSKPIVFHVLIIVNRRAPVNVCLPQEETAIIAFSAAHAGLQSRQFQPRHRRLAPSGGCLGSKGVAQCFLCFLTDLMKRPKALSFLRLSREDIS